LSARIGLTRWRRAALLAGALLLAAAVLVVGREVWARSVAFVPPNVVLIVADDMRFDAVWAMPTVQQFAERGITFTRAFVTTPLCCPSRASILTGQYARSHGVRANEPPLGGIGRFDERSTLATWLQAAGVRTGLVGRHLNGYRALSVPPGWEFWFAILQQGEDNGLYHHYYVNYNGEDEFYGSSSEHYSTRVLGRRALQMLREEPSRPFMLMLTPRAPHAPATPDRRDAGSLRDLQLPWPPSFDESDVSDKPSLVRALPPLSPAERERITGLRRRQLESLRGLDREIASIVEALRSDGRLARTWIIFTSDNGLAMGEHRLHAGKTCAYEECVRVPMVIMPPGGLNVPRIEERLVANIDLAPTVAEIMGITPGGPVDGRSLLPLLNHPSPSWRDGIVLEQWQVEPRGRAAESEAFVALRTEDRKYIRYETGEEELYDETADPYELSNLAGDPARAGEKANLSARLAELLEAPVGQQPPP
jgi:N-acetylglucosamine-6-sulfatase